MDWIRGIIGLLALVYVLQAWKFKSKNKKQRFPPGPRGFPLLGSLHMLGELPHRDLHQLAHKHGDIMYMRLGLADVVVASSPRAAELFLKTHDLNFASRPPTEAAKHISYGQSGLSFGEYGAYWRTTRKMCSLELLSNQKINSFKSMRKEELALLTKFIQEAASVRTTVDLSGKVSALTADMSCLMVFGKKYEDNEFDERGITAVMQEGMHLAATPNLGDFIPFIAPLDLQGLTKRMKGVSKVFDAFFEKIIDAHIQSTNQERTKDFVDVMLGFMGSEESEYRVERSNIKAIILDMLAGATDTSATAVEWTLSELIKHPRVMKKLQKELETVVGMERPVDESDLEKLAYLDMVLKESMRLHPVAPLMIPHAAIEDCDVDGFHVPRNSRVLINVWAIGRDPSAWTDANKFIPERFDGSNIDFRGRDFQFLPFGSGRRGCPGMQLGLVMVQLVVAQLVHCFDWELPNNMLPTELDMTEEFGLTVPRAKHLLAVPTYRLQH